VLGTVWAFAIASKTRLSCPIRKFRVARSTAIGHAGKLIVVQWPYSRCRLAGVLTSMRLHAEQAYLESALCAVWVLSRRSDECAGGVNVNSGGSLCSFRPHQSAGQNPLMGRTMMFWPRFPDMSEAYAKNTRCCALRCEGNGPGSSGGRLCGGSRTQLRDPGGDPYLRAIGADLVVCPRSRDDCGTIWDERPRNLLRNEPAQACSIRN